MNSLVNPFLRIAFVSFIVFVSASNATTVTNTNDNGPGSLRDAIAVTSAGGTVDFALQNCPCMITLTSGTLTINKDLTIMGPGADQLTISGNNAFRVLYISTGSPVLFIHVTIDGVRVANGNNGGGFATGIAGGSLTLRNSVISNNTGGGLAVSGSVFNCLISNNTGFRGAGIQTGDTVILNSTISNNHADVGGGIYIGFPSKSMTISGSTIEGNTAVGLGGGIYNDQALNTTIINSTVSGNSSTNAGGGIANLSGLGDKFQPFHSTMTIENSTISNNVDAKVPGFSAGGIYNSDDGSAMAKITLKNTIVTGNGPSNLDIIHRGDSGGFTSSGYNLIGNVGNVTAFTQPGDQAGTSSLPVDPLLYPLAFNGGPTRTHALKLNSPAVDKGKAFSSTTDQRGILRPNDNPELANAIGGDGSDIGAYEVQFPVSGTVTLAGRIMFSGGIARSRGSIRLVDSVGNVRWTTVLPTGNYRFFDVPLGRSFTISLYNKAWSAPAMNIFTAESVSNLDLTANRSP